MKHKKKGNFLTVFALGLFLAVCMGIGLSGVAAADNGSAETGERQAVAPVDLFASMLDKAEKGDSQAMLAVGALLEQGTGIPRNLTRALEWYEKAGKAGEAEGVFRAGLCYEVGMGTGIDMARAVENFERAVSMGSSRALHKLAALHFFGRGVPRDEARGLALLQQAAEAGNGAAANELAGICLGGLFGVAKDTAKAREWLERSADAGNHEGIKNLAVLLKDGLGQEPAPAEALRWYLVLQKAGDRDPALEKVISELRGKVSASQAQNADRDAEKWIADRRSRAEAT
jgi:TPR repeat protein